MSHEYAKAGTYNIKIEASNSISSVSDEFPLKIFGKLKTTELFVLCFVSQWQICSQKNCVLCLASSIWINPSLTYTSETEASV